MGAEHKIDDAMSRDEKRYYAKENEAKVPYLHTFFRILEIIIAVAIRISGYIFILIYTHNNTLFHFLNCRRRK